MLDRNRDGAVVGRKSRAKAERRAERVRGPDQQTAGTLPRLGTSQVSDASVPAPQQGTTRFPVLVLAPPPHPVDPGARLRLLLTRQRAAERDIEEEVSRLIKGGHSWTIVGAALGLTRQGARQRYRGLLGGGAGGPTATDAAG